jgi:two-component system OmpR family response regulator
MRVLIVEDDVKLAGLIQRAVREQAALADVAHEGEDALWMADATPYDVIVLDVNLPGINGFETCRRLRAARVPTPILMLTARASVTDRVTGLDTGADDYLVKPFDVIELLARIRALARRGPVTRGTVLSADDLSLDPGTQVVRRGGTRISLSTKEFQLLEVFMRRPGQVLSRYDLLEGAWDMAYENKSNVIDVYIRYLRNKIDRPFGMRTIETVRGAGYRLAAAAVLPSRAALADCARGLRSGQGDAGVRAALRPVTDGRGAAVRDGNGRDQGQPEPAAGIARPPPAAEALERAPRDVLGETAALIGDVQPDQLAVIAGGQRDRAPAVPQRVGDEVVKHLRHAVGITKQPAAWRHVTDHDPPPLGPGGGPSARRRRREQPARFQRPQSQRKPTLVRLCQQQHVIRQPAQAADLIRRRPERRPEFAGIPVTEQRQLDLRAQRGQRRSQLVTGDADQLPFLRLRPLVRYLPANVRRRHAYRLSHLPAP